MMAPIFLVEMSHLTGVMFDYGRANITGKS